MYKKNETFSGITKGDKHCAYKEQDALFTLVIKVSRLDDFLILQS